MKRVSLKVTGAQGQGVNSVGEMCAKGLKRAGYCVFGYREYMSLIKGGHSSYQLDISDGEIGSSESMVDVLICFNHHGLERNISDVKDGGIILHQTPQWTFDALHQDEVRDRSLRVVYLPTEDILKKLNAKPILGNVLITAVVWSLFGRDKGNLRDLVQEQFGHKKDLLELNFACIDEGFAFAEQSAGDLVVDLPEPDARWRDALLVTGSEAMGLGAVHAGCRVYVGYPMTPSSPLLTYIAAKQNETGMVVKQAEDEITAVQMMSGAMYMGTRAMTATSGGGYDLMTESISLNGMIENPAVVVLAQRPGPATGLPTWTAQGDLLLATHSAHGEFPRLVLGVGDSDDSFYHMAEAFNYAEQYQIPVTVLTDKHLAEALWTQPSYRLDRIEILRGDLRTGRDARALQPSDRYTTETETGITPRWIPGHQAATYCAQGDEHEAEGNVDESAENAVAQMDKRMRKVDALLANLPDPELFIARGESATVKDEEDIDILLVSWGSNKRVIFDALSRLKTSGLKIGYLHYTYLWPLKTERFNKLREHARDTILIECNKQGQLGMLLRQQTGCEIDEEILKYDGRPFFVDELTNALSTLLSTYETQAV